MTNNTPYKPIHIPNSDEAADEIVDIELDDVTALQDEDQQEPEVKEQVVEKPAKKDDDFGFQKKASRAQKRIKQLHGRAAELEQALEQERIKNAELLKQYSQGAKATKEDQQKDLENQVKLLMQRQIASMKEGNDEEVAVIQDEIFDIKLKLNNLKTEIKGWKEPEEVKQQPKQPQVSEKALEWIEDHPQFKTDEYFYSAALITNQKLIKEGFDPESDEFYQEINRRLAPKFPEVFGKKGKKEQKAIASEEEDGVEYTEDDISTHEDDDGDNFEDTETNTEPTMKRRQIAASSSRSTPTNQVNKGQTKNKVQLTQQDLRQAERWGLTPQQMARRIMHAQKNKRPDGYVPIFIEGQ